MRRDAREPLIRLMLAIVAAAWCIPAANAHPHVWARVEIDVIVADGALAGIRHTWTFDEMFSTFSIYGIGNGKDAPTREQLAPLARRYVESIRAYNYFTRATVDGREVKLREPESYSLDMRGEALQLQFMLPAAEAVSGNLTLAIYDPSYYVALSLAGERAARLEGAPPHCRLSVRQAEQPKAVDESFFRSLKPEQDWAAQFATVISMTCD